MSPIVLIVGYLALVTVIGSLLARRTSSSKDWAVAGGGMGMGMIAVGVAGTRIGGAGGIVFRRPRIRDSENHNIQGNKFKVFMRHD